MSGKQTFTATTIIELMFGATVIVLLVAIFVAPKL